MNNIYAKKSKKSYHDVTVTHYDVILPFFRPFFEQPYLFSFLLETPNLS